MKGCYKVVAACSLIIHAAVALDPPPSVTVVHNIDVAIRQDIKNIKIAAVVPTEKGQIGINPPGPAPTPANIEGHTKYLTVAGGTTKWIGSDPNNIAVTTTTTTKKGGATAVATITKGVSAIKAADGGLNILLGPKVKAKLEAIAKQVKPCGAKRKRDGQIRKRGPSCGLADFVQRVGADEELQSEFAHPLTDQAFDQIDEGYVGDPATDHGWEGNGGHHPVHEDEGYYSDDGEGFFEGSEAGEGANTVETIVFSSEEEAAAIAAALSGGGAAEAAGIWGGSTVTAGSFLAFIWTAIKDGKPVANVNKIPKQSIHKITKTKTKTTSTPTPSSSCPKATGPPPSCGDCKPTSVKVEGAKASGVVHYACSQGKTKGCKCQPKTVDRVTFSNTDFHQAVLGAITELEKKPREALTSCDGSISPVSSKFLVDKTANGFCAEVMKNLNNNLGATAYDIDGNKIPLLKMVKVASEQGATKRALERRSPPEDSKNYKDYKFFLTWKHEDGTCVLPKEDLCKNAYKKLVQSQCGSNHGSAGDRMYVDASIDVGCGTFSWRVDSPPKPEPAPPKPTFSERKCHDAHKHYDVHANFVDVWSSFLCKDKERPNMKAGDKELYWHPIGGDYHQNYKISWIEGCTVTKEQNVDIPIEGDKVGSCGNLLRDNYYKCNNGGAGGSIDAGCLRYDMYVT